ncbi:MAG TPA: MobF family relaxase [Opitutaceae bacterium]|nr:MobF family relaxase [Opitutaceae bacterium]
MQLVEAACPILRTYAYLKFGRRDSLRRAARVAEIVAMITAGIIRNGANYLPHHLRKNDYWPEGEKEVQGEWIGEGARALALEGGVTDEPFEALRSNRNPRTGEALTKLGAKKEVAFVDIQLSAPKDVSVLAMVGGDERVRIAFTDSVKVVIDEMEKFAAVRERRGEAKMTEAYRLTANFVGALFIHDASRDLDPQLHAHAVLANATWDSSRTGWFALQPAEMLRASPYLRQVLYRELAGRLRSLGHEPYDMSTNGFSIRARNAPSCRFDPFGSLLWL